MESLLDDAGDVVDIPDEIAVLHHGKGHPEKVGLLESPTADHLLGHLTGDGHQGNRIHVGIGDAGDQIRSAGTRGGHADTGLTGHTGISLGRKSSTLLVAGKDGTDFLRLGQGLMDRHRASTRVGKDIIDPLAFQGSDQDLRSVHNRAAVNGGLGFGGSGFFKALGLRF